MIRSIFLVLLSFLLLIPTSFVGAEDNEAPVITNVEVVSQSEDGETTVDNVRPNINSREYYFESTGDYIGVTGDKVLIRVQASDNDSGIEGVYLEHLKLEQIDEGIFELSFNPSDHNTDFFRVRVKDNAGNTSDFYVRLKILSEVFKYYNEKVIELPDIKNSIKVSFSKEMDIHSFNGNVTVIVTDSDGYNDLPNHAFNITLSEDKQSAYISFSEELSANQNHYLIINKNVKDLDGNALGNPMFFKFKSAFTDLSYLEIVSAEGLFHEISGVQKDKIFTIEFNSSVDPSTVDSDTVYVTDKNGDIVPTALSLSDGNKELRVSPFTSYKSGETYNFYVKTEIKSAKGVNLRQGLSGTFTIIDEGTTDESPEVVPIY